MSQKLCRMCGRVLDLSAFNKSSEYGTQSRCRECQKTYRKKYRSVKENKERESAKGKQYKLENRVYLAEQHKRYYDSHRDQYKKYRVERYKNNPEYFWAYDTLARHAKRGYEINISRNELIELAKKATRCPICDIEFAWRGNGRKAKHAPSLDRLNNENTISKDNIWIICQRCNASKGDKPMKEFVEYCKTVVSKFGDEMGIDPEMEVKA